MKKVVSCILAAFLLVAAAIPCFAAEAEPAVVSVLEEDLGNGVQCVTTVYMDPLQVRSNQCQGHVFPSMAKWLPLWCSQQPLPTTAAQQKQPALMEVTRSPADGAIPANQPGAVARLPD